MLISCLYLSEEVEDAEISLHNELRKSATAAHKTEKKIVRTWGVGVEKKKCFHFISFFQFHEIHAYNEWLLISRAILKSGQKRQSNVRKKSKNSAVCKSLIIVRKIDQWSTN